MEVYHFSYPFIYCMEVNQLIVKLFMKYLMLVIVMLIFASCTYAPRNTKIDQTYTARQMAIGVTEQPKDTMSSSVYEEKRLKPNNSYEDDMNELIREGIRRDLETIRNSRR